MKTIILALLAALMSMTLSGCLASSTSPEGLNCNSGTPFRELPIACYGH
jgi:hypothetical protein